MAAPFGRALTALRILFGAIWAVDAYLKWQPGFLDHLVHYFQVGAAGQPAWLLPWFAFWIRVVSVAPHLWAVLTAVVETFVAVALLLGWARKVAYGLSVVLGAGIWITAEGFGGPYGPGATDIGSSLLYAVIAGALWVATAAAGDTDWALDHALARRWAAWTHWGRLAPEAPPVAEARPRRSAP